MASFYDGAQVSMAPGAQSLDSLFRVQSTPTFSSGQMSFAPSFQPVSYIDNAISAPGANQSFGFNQTKPGGLLSGAIEQPQMSFAPTTTPPENSLGAGSTIGQDLSETVGGAAKSALSTVNELMGKLFKKENQGALTLAGALLTAGGQRSNEKAVAKENEKTRDWKKQMEDLQQQYAKELLELRQPKFEGGRTHGSFK